MLFRSKLKSLSAGAKAALKGFTAPFTNIMKNIKGAWKDGVKSEEIRKTINDLLKKSFDSLNKQLDKVETPEEIENLYNDMSLAIAKLNDDLNKQIQSAIKESVNYEDINENANLKAAGTAVSAIMKSVSGVFNNAKDTFKKEMMKAKELQKKKSEAKDFFKKVQGNIEKEVDKLDIKGMMDKARSGGQTAGEFNPGDEVT